MGTADREAREIRGKIVYYGAEGAGKTANLVFIQRKLKREHRGELKRLSTRDGVAVYETLPVELGAVRGYKTSIQISSVPGTSQASALRRQILDRVDGIVFVADLRPDRHQATVAALDELRKHLSSYGRELENVPLVVQYNHRDQADENAVERLYDCCVPGPPPGNLALGPNNWTNADDPNMPPFGSRPGMKMMPTNAAGWAAREIAIDGNAPLVWMAWWAQHKAAQCLALAPGGGHPVSKD